MSDCKDVFHQEVGITCQHFAKNIELERKLEKLQAKNEKLKDLIQERLDQENHLERCMHQYDAESRCICMDKEYYNHPAWEVRVYDHLKD